MKNQIALYARVSTKENGQNPKTQLVGLRDWADRLGRSYIEYVDQASGKDLNRPAWKRLTEDWRAGRVDTIAVTKLDRAFRSIMDMHQSFEEWQGRGIRFISLTQTVDTGTAAGRLLTNILGDFAEFEREMIGERVREGLDRAKREGVKLGRPKAKLSVDRARRVVDEHNGDIKAAAEALGVGTATVYRRIKKVG